MYAGGRWTTHAANGIVSSAMTEIRELRRAAGLKQREFAALLSVPLQTLRTWDSGRRVTNTKSRRCRALSHAAPIDPKHVHDAQVLGAVLHEPVPTVAPEALAPDVYGMDGDWGCERCELSRDAKWPLAPKNRMFELFGWTWQPNTRLQPTAASAMMSAAAEAAR